MFSVETPTYPPNGVIIMEKNFWRLVIGATLTLAVSPAAGKEDFYSVRRDTIACPEPEYVLLEKRGTAVAVEYLMRKGCFLVSPSDQSFDLEKSGAQIGIPEMNCMRLIVNHISKSNCYWILRRDLYRLEPVDYDPFRKPPNRRR